MHVKHSAVGKAKRDLAEALSLYKQGGSLLGQAITLSLLGSLHARLQNLHGAKKFFERSLAMFERLGYLPGRLNCSRWLATLNKKLPGSAAKSMEFYHHVKTLTTQLKRMDAAEGKAPRWSGEDATLHLTWVFEGTPSTPVANAADSKRPASGRSNRENAPESRIPIRVRRPEEEQVLEARRQAALRPQSARSVAIVTSKTAAGMKRPTSAIVRSKAKVVTAVRSRPGSPPFHAQTSRSPSPARLSPSKRAPPSSPEQPQSRPSPSRIPSHSRRAAWEGRERGDSTARKRIVLSPSAACASAGTPAAEPVQQQEAEEKASSSLSPSAQRKQEEATVVPTHSATAQAEEPIADAPVDRPEAPSDAVLAAANTTATEKLSRTAAGVKSAETEGGCAS